MPRIYGDAVAQIVRYPNGTKSDPFIVPMRKADVVRFATRIAERTNWTNIMLKADGLVDREATELAKMSDDFDPGSARVSCVYDGRWWATVRRWAKEASDYTVEVGGERLSMMEIGILFSRDDEFGWRSLHTLRGARAESALVALARTVLEWSKTIEEWEVA